LQTEDSLLLYKGLHQSALDIINPESRSFARISISSEYLLDHSPIRAVSVSSDTRFLSVAGKIGFAHLSTSSGRWRVLDTMEVDSTAVAAYEDIPLVRGGMCWYGNVFLVGADFGENHEVILLILPNRLMIRYVYIIEMLPT
jgi:hypothetical protein